MNVSHNLPNPTYLCLVSSVNLVVNLRLFVSSSVSLWFLLGSSSGPSLSVVRCVFSPNHLSYESFRGVRLLLLPSGTCSDWSTPGSVRVGPVVSTVTVGRRVGPLWETVRVFPVEQWASNLFLTCVNDLTFPVSLPSATSPVLYQRCPVKKDASLRVVPVTGSPCTVTIPVKISLCSIPDKNAINLPTPSFLLCLLRPPFSQLTSSL